MFLKVSNLSYKYAKKLENIIQNINLEIEKGSINLILGLNGSGKTTLLKTLVGINKNYEGLIEYDGVSLRDISVHNRSKIITYVSQLMDINDEINVLDFLVLGTTNTIGFGKVASQKEIKKAIEYANKLNLTNLLNKKIGSLSGGQKQLVNICCSCIQDSEIIFLDEPTSALDLKNQYHLLKVLKDISKKENKTVVFTSHNPNHGLFLDCNVILINDKTIKKVGKASEIITPENLKDIYGKNLCLSSDLEYEEISFKLKN